MFKQKAKKSVPLLSPVCRRRIRRYKESVSRSLPSLSSLSLSSKEERMTRDHQIGERRKYWKSSAQLKCKTSEKPIWNRGGRRTRSEWTKIRHSLDFIRKVKEITDYKTHCSRTKIDVKDSKTYFFLGWCWCSWHWQLEGFIHRILSFYLLINSLQL